MSENITHTAVLDDCFRLMTASEEICATFREIARTHRDTARLGANTRSGDRFTFTLLGSFRARWSNRTPEERLEEKLAFVLGWLCHRAADRQMKPVFREMHPQKTQTPTECSVYHDAFLFREVFALGKESPYHPAFLEEGLESMPASQGLDVPALEELFRVILQRALLEIHTFDPDNQDGEGWLDRLFRLRQTFHVDRQRYAEAVLRPDPEKYRRYIVEDNFYDGEEPIITAARALQRGEPVSPAQVHEAMRVGARSHYAQALRIAFGYLQAASEFWESDMTPEALKARLDVGKPGRDGKPV